MKIFIGRYPSDWVMKKNPKAEQKVRIKIDPWDTWNMAETLADIILPMLKQLRDDKHGSPGDMKPFKEVSSESTQYCFDWYKEDDMKAWDLGHKQWCDIMDKMIWSFEQVVDRDREDQFHTKKDGKRHFDITGYKQYYERIQEGLNLFGKYYMNLWD